MIGTVIIGDTPVDVYGTVCSAEPSVGIMNSYVDIEDLQIGGISVYEMIAKSNLWDMVQESINDQVGE